MIAINYTSLKCDKETLLKLAAFFSKEEGTCLLYSGGDLDSANCSFLFLFPFEKVEISEEIDEQKRWELLQSHLIFDKGHLKVPLWAGFLSYEMAKPSSSFQKLPFVYFQRSAVTFVLDHIRDSLTIYLAEEAKKEHEYWFKIFSSKSLFSSFLISLKDIVSSVHSNLSLVKEIESFSSYEKKIHMIQEMIRSGDVYQVNLSHEIELEGTSDPFFIFYSLTKINPAPFSAFFNHKDFTIVSSSPERFLKKEDDVLETRPIKGTIARGKSEGEDAMNREKLLNSEKDLAELLMITDLMRNDLGKVSLPGSVKTKKIVHLEAYENVFHLLSIIFSIPIPTLHPLKLIQSCFPGGSISGCPKKSAMQVIESLEERVRGIYTGSIGYFASNGDFDFNIAIRTLLFIQNRVYIPLGGAITIDSDAYSEYQETLQKGASILKALTII